MTQVEEGERVDEAERDRLRSWFAPRLAAAWDEQRVGSADVDEHRYVQWRGDELGLQLECVSNRFLPGDAQLTTADERRLRRLGWHEPLGDDLPNFWRVYLDRQDLPQAVHALVGAVGVLRCDASYLTSRPVRPVRVGRVVVVVPVAKVAREVVARAVEGAVDALPAAGVIDLTPFGSDDLPPLPMKTVESVLLAGPALNRAVLVETGLEFSDGGVERSAGELSALLRDVRRLVQRGRDVVVVGPWLLPGTQWLYAAALEAAADAVVLCVSSHDEGHLDAGLVQDVRPALAVKDLVVVAAERLPERPWRVAGLVDAVVETDRPGRAVVALSLLLRTALGDREVLDERSLDAVAAVVDAALASVQARLLDLPQVLATGRDVRAAEALLSDLVAVVRTYLPHTRDVALHAVHVLSPLLDRLVGAAHLPEVRAVVPALRWLAACAPNAEPVVTALRALEREQRAAPRRASGSASDRERLLPSERDVHYVPPGTTCRGKAEFAQVLRDWFDHPDRETVMGRPGSYGGKPLLAVDVDGRRFHLNADTREAGVREYLRAVAAVGGPDLPWQVIANNAGKVNKVAVGHPPRPLRYFYLYADDQAAEPYVV